MGKMIMNGVSYGINANSTIYGAFIDTTNILKPRTAYAGSFSYTATQDCAVVVDVANATSNSAPIFIDGALVGSIYGSNSADQLTDTYYIKRGQTISGTTSATGAEVGYTVYGLLYNAGETTNTVIPNPQAVPRDTLDSISIGGMVYDVGSKYGAFIDTNRIIQPVVTVQGSTPVEYTATEDCGVVYTVTESGSSQSMVYINDVMIKLDTGKTDVDWLYLRKGDSLRITGNSAKNYTVFGLIQGTNNIFTPQIYSLEEKCVGVWIDNKPLYQKTLVYNNITKGRVDNLAHNISDIDKIVYNDWVFVNSQNHQSVTGFENTSNNYWAAIFAINDIGISYRIGTDWAVDTLIVNVKYTKTTDVAGSGSYNTLGVPMVHIEDNVETVIGTYNGKPLYQQTLCYTESSEQTEKKYDISGLTTDYCKLMNAEVKLGSFGGNHWYTSPFYYDSQTNMCVTASPDDEVINVYSRNWKFTQAKVTLQYTKITD